MPTNKNIFLPRELAYVSFGEEMFVDSLEIEKGKCDFCCGRLGDSVYLTRKFFSKNFTEWDRFLELGENKKYICSCCSWFFSEKNLRTKNILIKEKSLNEYTVKYLNFNELHTVLKEPFAAKECLTIPFSGRKHLLPYTRWQCISTDEGNILWSEAESLMFSEVFFLRSMNIPVRIISGEESLTTLKLSSFQKDELQNIFEVWHKLKPWNRSLAFRVACHVVKGFNPEDRDEKQKRLEGSRA
jgi:hypothetical protein